MVPVLTNSWHWDEVPLGENVSQVFIYPVQPEGPETKKTGPGPERDRAREDPGQQLGLGNSGLFSLDWCPGILFKGAEIPFFNFHTQIREFLFPPIFP